MHYSGASHVVLVVKNLPADAGEVRDMGSIPVSGRFPWRRSWQLTPVFLPRESRELRSLVTYNPRGCKELDTTEVPEHTRRHPLQYAHHQKLSFYP